MLTMSVSHLVPMEFSVRMFYSMLSTLRDRAFISMLYIEVIIDMATESIVTVEPRTRSNKYATAEPLRPIISMGRAGVGSVVVIAVRTNGSRSNTD